MTEREKIHSGDIYWPSDPDIMEEQLAYLDLMDEYNRTPRRLQAERAEMLKKLFAEANLLCVKVPHGDIRFVLFLFFNKLVHTI